MDTRPAALTASLVAIAAIIGRAGAAPPPPSSAIATVSLQEALAHAREHQPRIRAALAELLARQREARVPLARWYPRIGATAQIFGATSNNTTASYLGVRDVDLPRIGSSPGAGDTAWAPVPSTLVA